MSIQLIKSPEAIALSAVSLPHESAITRDCTRPRELRNERFADQFDWRQLFYDVYRVRDHIVLQGPPLRNLLPHLRSDPLFAAAFRPIFPRARHIDRARGSEIWLKRSFPTIELDNALGRFSIPVQPESSDLFAGKRVLHTLSKDNRVAWILDWITYYRERHGADGVLLYDNGSSLYDATELQAELTATFPDMTIRVIHWPFLYGPQGGMAGAVDGVEAPWDSDFCQAGSLQHARFRFLTRARSVLNVDIDELILSSDNDSIFEATEKASGKFVKFPGRWIGNARARFFGSAPARHAQFHHFDAQWPDDCPPKWCIAPDGRLHLNWTWSAHNLFGARANKQISDRFSYRHMRAISNSWKEERGGELTPEGPRFTLDSQLQDAFAETSLAP